MQEDRGILPILFMSALPFGLIDKEKNIATLQRDFVISSLIVPTLLPIQADFAGGGSPIMTFNGRKGAFSTLDLFNSKVNNHNFYIAATTGSGKSFLVNYITYNQFAANGIARIIDIGRSYRKMTKMLGAQFIDFTEDADICINPFSGITDIKTDISTIAAIIMQMIFSATDKVPNDIAETGSTLVKEAIEWAFSQEGTDACIDHVHTYLKATSIFDRFQPGDMNIGSSALEDFKKISTRWRSISGILPQAAPTANGSTENRR
jgi:conjugal transfer ATP-binding protein TraC